MKNRINNWFALVLLSLIVLLPINSFAQLSGTKSIPGDYATIESAIADLNLQGVGPGGVTFNVSANHTETFSGPTAGLITATGTQLNPIIFQKSGTGANPIITAGTGTGSLDGIIVIAGGDYITFDRINVSENSANTDDISRMEWGYALLKKSATAPVDGCYFVTIQYSVITLNKSNTATWGIYAANHTPSSSTGLTLSDTLDVMSYCKFDGNSITAYNGIRIISATTAEFFGKGNEIGVIAGNNILAYGDGSATAYGMNIEYQDNLKIAHNSVNGGGASHTGLLYGIRTGSGTNSNVDIYLNSVTVTQSGTSLIYAIVNSMGSSGTNNTVNIYNNTVENCLYSGSSSNSFWMIYNLASAYTVNIYGNRLRNNTKSAGTGPIHCIYNSPTTATVNANIYNNEIHGNSSAGPMNGIYVTAGTNNNIYGNKIYDIRTTSSSGSAVSGILIPSGPVNTYIYNNFISDLKAPNSADVNAVRGISITSTTANSNIGLYYNTIFLNATGAGNFGSSGIFHTNSTTSTTANLDMRNNIVVNLSNASGTGKTVAFRRSAVNVNLNNYSTLSNNNCFYAGTPGASNVIFFDGTNFDQTIEEFKTRVAPRETFSFTESVPFVNDTTAPYDLHVRTDVATQTESGGTPITSPITITTDYDGDLRNATTPDVGADEFNGIGTDITPPAIVYTDLTHTTSTANRTLSGVSITDQNGVNVTPGTAPRIYFKRSSDNNTFVDNTPSTNGWKYIETSSPGNPFDFLINYSLLFGGTGVQMGDTIQYFVVAQDLFNPANVGISEGVFASPPSSVNLTPAAFPITGNINFYRIIILLNGTVTVGTGGNYQSLTGDYGLFKVMNENIISGNITAQIIDDLNETGGNTLNQWIEDVSGANYTLTIQPNSAVNRTISGTYKGGLIRLNGADRVTIDGRYNGSGNYLTFINNKDTNNTATFQLISLGAGLGCSNVTIRNCNIKAGINSVANVFGIFGGSSTGSLSTGNAGGADFDNISIIENKIYNTRNGLWIRGTSSDQMTNLLISGNIIGADVVSESITEYGMYIGYADAPQVLSNEVYNMYFDVSKWPIYFVANVNNAVVSKNKIHSIKQPGTTGYNSTGIYFSSGTNCFDNQIDNNMIYDLSTYGNTSMYLYGIRIAGGSNYKIYYNSISITDTIGNTAVNLPSACLYISAASTNMDIRNNIFLNTRVGNSPKNYAVYTPNTTTFQFIDYNDYWTTGSVIGYFGADIATLNDWKTATGQDANSISDDPHYLSETDLHINPSFSTVCDIGVPIASVTTDIDGDIRSATTPDIGADEYNCGANTFQLTVDIANGWNMVSIPGLHPVDQNVDTWWQYRDPGANVFKYSGGYQVVSLATPGIGYWMKHAGARTYNTGDEWPAGGIQIVAHDPIPGTSGWNLVGGYEASVATSGMTTTPPGLIIFPVYKYSSGYQVATTLDPGYGYWVKLSGAGQINIPSSMAKGSGEIAEYFPKEWGRIILTDASGINYTLYAVKGEVDLNLYELPPAPPAGMFDIRYGSGRIAEDINSSVKTIELNGVTYPVTVRVEGMDIRLMDETGKGVNVNLKSGEDVVISDGTIQKLKVSGELLPTVYSLEQNYPNPFNPSTVIEFSLPEDVSNVKLSIYNALGEKVAELVNSSLTAGKYQYQWNAQNVATGMYIYELRTDKFVSVKKMLLLK
ncbi:MAG: T9SS type A sorting domain-containing protein [Ignavibacteriaceae bacterium]|nr:T9SS type A sorting domain-containing protein [Ignavibacteriaceae bacterium]